MDAGGGGNPVLAPILFQQRPQYLIDILTVPANRASKDPLLDGPELPERGVAAPVLAQHARLETARANCAKGERSDEAHRFDEHTVAARRRCYRAFPFRDF